MLPADVPDIFGGDARARFPNARASATGLHVVGIRRRADISSAFSLIEVTLSIGIVAFAFVALLGLLPVGLTTFRQAIDTTVGSQIVQRIVDEAQQTDYPSLIANPVTTRYFDDQGNEVAASASIYTAEIVVTSPSALPNTTTPASASLATITVKLANNPGHNPSPFGAGSKIPYAEYSAFIAKSQ